MQRLISIVFLCLLILKIGGYFAFLSVQQFIHKEETKEKIIQSLPKEMLVKLSFSEKEFANLDWEEENREFYFNNKLYDIVRSEFNGKTYTIYCFSDEKETVIYDKILQLSENHNDELPIKNNLASFLNLLLLKYIVPAIFSLNYEFSIIYCDRKFTDLTVYYTSIISLIFIPPPQV